MTKISKLEQKKLKLAAMYDSTDPADIQRGRVRHQDRGERRLGWYYVNPISGRASYLGSTLDDAIANFQPPSLEEERKQLWGDKNEKKNQ